MNGKTEDILFKLGGSCIFVGLIFFAADFILTPNLWWATRVSFIVGGSAIFGSFLAFKLQLSKVSEIWPSIPNSLFGTSQRHCQYYAIGSLLILVALPIFIIFIKYVGIADGTNFYDFGAYYNAAERAIYGHPLYDPSDSYDGVTPLPNSPNRYLYAPIIVLLFIPFTLFSPDIAAFVWTLCSITVYLLGIRYFTHEFGPPLSRVARVGVYLGALCFGPFIVNVIAGQVSGMITAILCVGMVKTRHSEIRGADRRIGTAVATASAFKIFYAPVGAVLLRKRSRLLAALSTGLLLAIFGIVLFGVDTSIAYIEVLQQGKGWGSAADPPSEWNITAFHPFYVFGSVHFLLRFVVLATIAAMAIYSRRFDGEYMDAYIFLIGILGVILGAPTIAMKELTALVPVILFLLLTTYRHRNGLFIAVLFSTLLIHIQPYLLEFFTTFLPNVTFVPSWVYSVLPFFQPAVWGVGILLVVTVEEFSQQTKMQ